MIIRGNTVGTNMSPERIADKIGVPVLYVDIRNRYDEDLGLYYASHGADQIVEHLEKGGTVVGTVIATDRMTGIKIPLSGIFEHNGSLIGAHFRWVGGTRYTNFEIKVDGRVYETVTISATTDDIGDISSALDEIREYAENLINGGGSE